MIDLRPFNYRDAELLVELVDPVCQEKSIDSIRDLAQSPNHETIVAEFNKQHPVGLLIWEMVDNELHIHFFSFYPRFMREVFELFTNEIKNRLGQKWERIIVRVREKNDHGWIELFKEFGFHILQEDPVIRKYYKDEDAFVMECTERVDVKIPAHA